MSDFIVFILQLLVVILLTICIMVVSSNEGVSYKKKLAYVFHLDTRKGLGSQSLLWFSVIIPIAIALLLWARIWPEYSLEMSADGFKLFLSVSILPLGIMSIALPVAGLISSFHSTQQAAVQIRETQAKNKMDSFFAHRRELISYFSAIENPKYFGRIEFSMRLHPAVHARYFNGAPTDGWPSIVQSEFTETNRLLNEAAKCLEIVILGKYESREQKFHSYLAACECIIWMARHLEINGIYERLVSVGVRIRNDDHPAGEKDFYTVGTTTEEALASLRFVSRFFRALCDYAGGDLFKRSSEHDGIFGVGANPAVKIGIIESFHKKEISQMAGWNKAFYSITHPISVIRENESQ